MAKHLELENYLNINASSITIPNTIASFNAKIERYDTLTQIIFEESCQIYNLSYNFYHLPITTITIPASVETISSNGYFSNCPSLTTIYINKPEGSIIGAPWGATNATVIWNG